VVPTAGPPVICLPANPASFMLWKGQTVSMIRRVMALVVVLVVAGASVPVFATDANRCAMLHAHCARVGDMPCCHGEASARHDRSPAAARFAAPAPDLAPDSLPLPAGTAVFAVAATLVPFHPPHGYHSGDLLTRLSSLLI
jgi:hypothetical protein